MAHRLGFPARWTHRVGPRALPAPGPPAASYVEPFASGTGDFYVASGAGTTLTNDAGRLLITLPAATQAVTDVWSASVLNIKESSLFALIDVSAMTSASDDLWFGLSSSDTSYQAQFEYTNSSLRAYIIGNGNPTTLIAGESHRWWRIRETGGAFYFDTSADGATWVAQWNAAHLWPDWVLGRMQIEVWLYPASTTSARTIWVDSINVAQSAPTGVGTYDQPGLTYDYSGATYDYFPIPAPAWAPVTASNELVFF